jgi:hypothetical protein
MSYLSTRNYGLEAARGNVPNVTTLNKFGRAPSGIQTTATDVWSRADSAATQQIWIAPTTARVHAIVSSSASDASAGVGARTVRIQGLTAWNTAEATETVTLNGVTPVNTANSYVIIHKMKVLTSGATSINVGQITATAATDATVTAEIEIGQGQTQMAIYGVPSTQSFYMTRFYAYMNDSISTTRVDVQLRANENPDVQRTNFINKYDMQLANAGVSALDSYYEIPIKFAGPCIIKVHATSNSADTDMSAGFDGYLITN